jgi:AcrR family transcriptional regulator
MGAGKQGRSGKADAARAAVLRAGFEEFVEHGFAGARIDRVASLAGVSKGAVYLHVKSKEALFEAVLRESLSSRIAAMRPVVDGFSGSTEALLRTLAEMFKTEILGTSRREMIRLVLSEGGRFPHLAEIHYQAVVAPGLDTLRALAARGIARGEVRPGTLERFPQLLVAPLLMAVFWKALFEPMESLDTDALIDTHLSVLLDGIRPEAS